MTDGVDAYADIQRQTEQGLDHGAASCRIGNSILANEQALGRDFTVMRMTFRVDQLMKKEQSTCSPTRITAFL